ncbi:MAG: hypothetical protein AAF750_14390 [Planctomycetota bacterium]
MASQRMTYGQWRASLGDAVELERVPKLLGMPPMLVASAVKAGRLRVSTFRAGDGRAFRMVRRSDVLAFRDGVQAKPLITMEGLRRAFQTMAEV